MNLEIKKHKKFIMIRFARICSITRGNKEEYKSRIYNQYKKGKTIILNFDKVRYVDSAGLAALLDIRRKIIESQGKLKLTNLNPSVLNMIKIKTSLMFSFDSNPRN